MTKGGGGGLSVVTSCRTLHKMSYAGQWLVCAVCDGHCWDDYTLQDDCSAGCGTDALDL